MAQIIIPQYIPGTSIGTLSGIAQQYKTDIPTLQKLNSQITDINKIQAGAILNVPDVEKPITSAIGQNQAIISSDLARNQYEQDIEKLGSLEAGISQTPPMAEKPQEGAILPQETLLEKPAITFKSANPAFQSVLDQTNEAIKQFQSQGGTLTPEINQQLNNINNFQFQKTQAIANARQAEEEKDATKLNEELTKVKEAETAQKTSIDTLRKNLETARAGVITSLTPTEKETELKKKLITLRTERQLLPLELRQEGISAAGIAGRQVEDERVRAIQESNLLAEIGLEQESRQMKQTSFEKQAEFIWKDIELQNKIQEKLTEQENKVVEQTRNLRKDSLDTLKNILDSFEGLAWGDMDAQTQTDIIKMISPYKDLTTTMVSDALKISKQQKVFDNALKTAQEVRLSREEKKIYTEKTLPGDIRQSIVETLTDKAGAKKLNRELKITDLMSLFPEIERETLQSYMDDFYDYEELIKEETTGKKWWQFWRD